MKLLSSIVFAFLIGIVFMTSCDTEEKIIEEICEFDYTLEPVCDFNPKNAQTVSFPVRVVENGKTLSQPEYTFSWSSDSDFHGSAISISYEELPLTAEVTETATGCVEEKTLEKSYFD